MKYDVSGIQKETNEDGDYIGSLPQKIGATPTAKDASQYMPDLGKTESNWQEANETSISDMPVSGDVERWNDIDKQYSQNIWQRFDERNRHNELLAAQILALKEKQKKEKHSDNDENLYQEIAKHFGAPIETVRKFPDSFLPAYKQAKARGLVKTNEATAGILADPSLSALAASDEEKMKKAEDAITNLFSWIKRPELDPSDENRKETETVLSDVSKSFVTGVADFASLVLRGGVEPLIQLNNAGMLELQAQTGGDEYKEHGRVDEVTRSQLREPATIVKDWAKENFGVSEEREGYAYNQIARGVGQAGAQIVTALGTAGYSLWPTLVFQGLGTGSEKFEEIQSRLKKQGVDVSESQEYLAVALMAATTAFTERLGLEAMTTGFTPQLMQYWQKSGNTALWKMFGRRNVRTALGLALAGLGEGTQEVSETLGQAAVGIAVLGDKERPSGESLFTEFAYSSAVGLITGGIVNMRRIALGKVNEKFAKQFVESVKEIKNETVAKEFAEKVGEKTGAKYMYISAWAWRDACTEQGLDPVITAKTFGVTNANVAINTNGRFAVPIANVQELAKMEFFDKLTDHIAASEDALTPFETREAEKEQVFFQKAIQEQGKAIKAAVDEDRKISQALNSFQDDLMPDLVKVYGKRNARMQARGAVAANTTFYIWDEIKKAEENNLPRPNADQIVERLKKEWARIKPTIKVGGTYEGSYTVEKSSQEGNLGTQNDAARTSGIAEEKTTGKENEQTGTQTDGTENSGPSMDNGGSGSSSKTNGSRPGNRQNGTDVNGNQQEGGPEGAPLMQGKSRSPRGMTSVNESGQMRIYLFKNADASTFMHETGHFMLENIKSLAQSQDSSRYIKNEFAKICSYLGADPNAADFKFTVDQHEKFARSFERYLMEGKAPSEGLKNVFRTFKSWLVRIYQNLKALNVELSPEIRGVFDRLMATERALDTAKQIRGGRDMLFNSAEEMGVTPEEFEEYKAAANNADEVAKEAALETQLRYQKRKNTREFKNRKRIVENNAKDEYSKRKDVIALRSLGKPDDLALNKRDLQDRKIPLNKLPKNNGLVIYSDEGMNIDDAAKMLGYPTGDELVNALTSMPKESEYIRSETDRIMKKEYGVMNDEELAAFMEQRLHDDPHMDVKLIEYTSLVRNAGGSGVKVNMNVLRRIIREYAASEVADMRISELRPHVYRRIEKSSANKAFRAMQGKNFAAAAEAKYNEILNGAIYDEALKAATDANRIKQHLDKYKDKNIKTLQKQRDVNAYYRIRYILAQHGIGSNPDAWLEKLNTAAKNGDTVDTTAEMKRPWKDLTYDEFKGMQIELDGIWDLSERSKKITIDGEEIDSSEYASKICDLFKDAPNRPVDRNGLLSSLNLMTTRVEFAFSAIDGGDGPLSMLYQQVKDGSVKARKKLREVTKALHAAHSSINFAHKKIVAKELIDKDTGLPHVFGDGEVSGGAELWGAILHTGNASNLKKLLLGYGWGTLNEDGTVDTANWDKFITRLKNEGILTKEYYDAAQKVWDVFEELKKDAQAANKYIYGAYFKEIPINGIDSPFGKYNGGYVPAKTDSDLVPSAKTNEIKDVDADAVRGLMPMTEPGFTKSRVENYNQMLDLNPRKIIGAVSRIINFSYIAPAYADCRKMFNRRDVTDAIGRYNNKLKTEVIAPALNRARQQVVTDNLHDPTARRFAKLRSRAGAVFMSLNIKNTIQQLADMAVAGFYTGPGNLMSAIFTARKDEIIAKSDFMYDRVGSSQESMFDQVNSILVDPSKLEKSDEWLTHHAYFLQQLADDRCSCIVWTAAYNDALQKGKTEKQSIRHADRTVRDILMSQNPEDVSNIEAGSSGKRFFTQFSGFSVTRKNLLFKGLSQIAKEAGVLPTDSASTKTMKMLANKKLKLLTLILATVAVPASLDTAIALALKGILPDDDEWQRDMFFGGLNYISGLGGPYVNMAGQVAVSFANKATGGKVSLYNSRIAQAPFLSLLEDAISISGGILNGKITADKLLKLGTELSVFVAPMPMQLSKSASYALKVNRGEITPTGTADYLRGLVSGTASPGTKNN